MLTDVCTVLLSIVALLYKHDRTHKLASNTPQPILAAAEMEGVSRIREKTTLPLDC